MGARIEQFLKAAAPPAGPAGRRVWIGLYGLTFLWSLFGSLKVTLGVFGPEADASHTLMLWYGVRDHGLAWVRDWIFTQDNWLLSLAPLHFALFGLFGAKSGIPVVFGWVIFVSSALLSGAIAWRLGARRAAIPIALVLLNLGAYAHFRGLASYTVSHNISNLFGLAAVMLLIVWAGRPRLWSLGLILLLLLCGVVSDPWMAPAYNLPIALTALVFVLRPTPAVGRAAAAMLLAVAGLSLLAVKTRLFGLFDFLPVLHFKLGAWETINDNAVMTVRDFGGMLNLVPLADSNNFLPALASCLIALSLAQFICLVAVRARLRLDGPRIAFLATAFFSIGGTILAMTLSSEIAVITSGRFVINGAYLAVVAAAVLAELSWKAFSAPLKAASVGVLCLLGLAGAASNAGRWSQPGLAFKDEGVGDTIRFLDQHGLTYGYGPYWGSNANAVTAATRSRIRLRPVTFGRTSGMMFPGFRAESSRRWFTAEDVPPGVTRYFVMLAPDGEECRDMELCVRGVTRQFGPPLQTLQHRTKHGIAPVLVWDHPLIGYSQGPILMPLGQKVVFSETGALPNGRGWSAAEAWGVWTDGLEATLHLKVEPPPAGDLELTVEGHSFFVGRKTAFDVQVVVNGAAVGRLAYSPADNGPFRIVRIPGDLVRKTGGLATVSFRMASAPSPVQLGESGDARQIGLGLISLSLK